jgi:hypothetical protein
MGIEFIGFSPEKEQQLEQLLISCSQGVEAIP